MYDPSHMLPKVTGYPLDPAVRSRRRPSQASRIEALRRVPLFAGLSTRNLARIDGISRVAFASTGRVIIEEGAPGDELMVVLDGRASVRRGDRTIAECGPGQWFGEMALLDDQPRSATVVADEPMRLLTISRKDFRKLLTKAPRLAETLLASLSTRIRELQAAAELEPAI
jgi:CRP-like cAMP-binding protein